MVQGSEGQTMLTLRRTKMQIQGQSSLLPQALLTLVQVTKLENVKSAKKNFQKISGSVRNESESPDSPFFAAPGYFHLEGTCKEFWVCREVTK